MNPVSNLKQFSQRMVRIATGTGLALATCLMLATGCASQSANDEVQLSADDRDQGQKAQMASDAEDPGNTGIGSIE